MLPVAGRLYVVATPIGNLGDLSARAAEILAQVDLVAAEDTRRTAVLMEHLRLRKPMISLHEHNEEVRTPALVERLLEGEVVALVSDAGTPLVSDPGYRLVRAAHEAGVTVSPIPGPSSVMAALSVAGLPTDRFLFQGFLPPKGGQRKTALEALAREQATLVFLESSHRIVASLRDLAEVFGGDRLILVARELTKLHETLIRGPIELVLERLKLDPDQRRGEFTLVVQGAAAPDSSEPLQLEAQQVLAVLMEALPLKQAVGLAARITGQPRNTLYRQALAMKG
ncbi:MAG: 16S rRNA (cytidine(1402)-2'-O)-methyltransferase [Ectothiorhodospiraceae bacterium]|nr:16S rRNA (cytidine(1402)-2'-O)-methyltransferase [Ectothiorhodospiraceae bacterium]